MFLSMLGGLMWLIAALTFTMASSAFQEIVAGTFGTSGSVLISAAAIVKTLIEIAKGQHGETKTE